MAATIVTVINQKGGVGKTTLSMNLAAGLHRRGPTVVLDTDPQRSATVWSQCGGDARKYPLEVLSVSGRLRETLESARFGHRYVVIDCPPATNAESSSAAVDAADVVLVPVLPSPMDLWASSGIEDMISSARVRKPALRAYLVLNQIEMRNAMSRDIEVVLREFSVPALRSGLTRRAIYRTAALEGCSVYELGLNGRHAAAEIENIVDEVLQS